MEVNKLIFDDQILREAIEIKNTLHQSPELSNHEERTAQFLKKEVSAFGFEIKETDKHGFIAILDTGQAGKTIALRTDMDALPIKEHPENLAGKKDVISQNDGVMHACGHDAHMAILLTSLKILASMKDQLTGRIIGIFEEGEENGSGIQPMLELLADEPIDAIYGNHIYPPLETGKICVDPGPLMAAYGVFDFTIVGKGGHGSRPDLAINPIFVGSQILNGISSAWNNQINVEEIVTLGVTKFHAGSTLNVIPDEATIGGTIRYFNVDEGKKALRLIERIATETAAIHNCSIRFNVLDGNSKPVVNDEMLARLAQKGIGELFPDSIVQGVKWFASETFSYYSSIAPTVFALIGTKNEEKGTGAEVHTDRFDVDHEAMLYGIGAMVKFAVNVTKFYW